MDKFTQLLKSRKFWAAVVGLALIIVRSFSPTFPLDDADVLKMVYLIVAYILGTSLEDARAKTKASG